MPKSNKKLIKSNKKVYLDYAASATPNPSSIHTMGLEVKKKLEDSRASVASGIFARPSEIIFTSGGTESNNLAILGAALASSFSRCALPGVPGGTLAMKNKTQAPHRIVTTNIEHPSVLETCKHIGATIVNVEENGIVDAKKIKKVLTTDTVLVSVMYANNEIGTIQPIREIAKEIRHFNKLNNTKILFHTDAVQAVNALDLNVEKLGVDMLTLSGAKVVGAGRVGVLYKKSHVKLEPVFFGGDQEMGLRPGTENVEAIVKFANAFEILQKNKEKESKRVKILREYFIKKINKEIKPGFIWNGDLENALPNILNLTFPKIPSDLLVIELSAKGIMTSSKSACKSSSGDGSYVIKAIHPEIDKDIGGLRLSFGLDTKKSDIDYTVKTLKQILNKLDKWYH